MEYTETPNSLIFGKVGGLMVFFVDGFAKAIVYWKRETERNI